MQAMDELITGEHYHVFTKSIAKFKVFNAPEDYLRMQSAMKYYQLKKRPLPFAEFCRTESVQTLGFWKNYQILYKDNEQLVGISAYCIMSTHIHFVMKQFVDDGISVFMSNILNSYTRYFNSKHQRKGPLWVGRYRRVLLKTDEQLSHVIRYVHLNPAVACLVSNPAEWAYSSYREYLGIAGGEFDIVDELNRCGMTVGEYRKFTDDQIGYQKELEAVKYWEND